MTNVTRFWFKGSIITRVEDDEFHVFAYDAKAFQAVLDKMNEITTGADTEKVSQSLLQG